MKFIGQFIQSLVSRFRNDVYLEDVSSGTIASGGNLGLDSNNKIVKADVPADGDITSVNFRTDDSNNAGATSGDAALIIRFFGTPILVMCLTFSLKFIGCLGGFFILDVVI